MAYIFFVTGMFFRIVVLLGGTVVSFMAAKTIYTMLSSGLYQNISKSVGDLSDAVSVSLIFSMFLYPGIFAFGGLIVAIYGLILCVGYIRRGVNSSLPGQAQTPFGRSVQIGFFIFVIYICGPRAVVYSAQFYNDITLAKLGERAEATLISSWKGNLKTREPDASRDIMAYFITFSYADIRGEIHEIERRVSRVNFRRNKPGGEARRFIVAYYPTTPKEARPARMLGPISLTMDGARAAVNLLLAAFGIAGLIMVFPWDRIFGGMAHSGRTGQRSRFPATGDFSPTPKPTSGRREFGRR